MYWLAAACAAYFIAVGLIRGGKCQEQVLMVPIKADSDADPRRRRQR
jgi:hypothetical protein